MASKRVVSLALLFSSICFAGVGPQDWTHYGSNSLRCSIAIDGPNTIDSGTLKWVAVQDPYWPDYNIMFENATGPVVYNGKVYAYAKYFDGEGNYTNSQIVAYDANTGEILWSTIIDPAQWDSISSPCIDVKHNTVLIGSGTKVFALDAQNGAIKWTTQLEKYVINASVCAASDIPYARAFIVDYDGFGSTGKLYCINLDPNEPSNPYNLGRIVWSVAIGTTSGNSPAYKNGVVYVATQAGVDNVNGTIYAFNATATNAVKLWQTTDLNFDGFFGGVTVTNEGFLYAASYNWADEIEDNSQLCKINCDNGNIVWIANVERTSSMPVVAGDKIYVSGGIDGWGSRPKVEAYHDLGNTVVQLWETPSGMDLGGWTNQAVYANGKLYVGAMPLGGDYFGGYSDLYILNVFCKPSDQNFIMAHYNDNECGNSPVVTYDSIYTIGADGLFKFYQPALLGDVNSDRMVNAKDLAEFSAKWLNDEPIGTERCDLNLDGKVDFADFALLANEWCKRLD